MVPALCDMSRRPIADVVGGMHTERSEPTVHMHFLLARSGSMASMAPDVIGGFNSFLHNQQAMPGRSRMTLVQFDSNDPFEVLTDGFELAQVRPLRPRTF